MNKRKRRFSFENEFSAPDFDVHLMKNLTFTSINIKDIEKEIEKLIEKKPSNTIIENNLRKTIKKENLNFDNFDLLQSFSTNELLNSCLPTEESDIEYLRVRKFKIPDDKLFKEKIIEKFSNDLYKKLMNHILGLSVNLNKETDFTTVGPFTEIEYLIEKAFNFDIKLEKEIKKQQKKFENIQYYRKIKGDGNCFYRCVLFQIFENIILNNKINILKGFIYEIDQCYQDKLCEGKLMIDSTNKIKKDLVIEILIVIYLTLKEKKVEVAYKIFIYSIHSCKTFDLGLVWYYRYTLFKYISENKNKCYSSSFNILIGNLLPEEYEKDGKFLYEDFFNKYLYKLYSDAEKIVIYLTPYIFGVNLNIFVFEYDKEFFTYEGKSNFNFNFEITVLYKKAHYELLYLKDYYLKFKKYLEIYSNIQPFVSIIKKQPKTEKINIQLKPQNNNLNISKSMITEPNTSQKKKKKINLVNKENNIDEEDNNNNGIIIDDNIMMKNKSIMMNQINLYKNEILKENMNNGNNNLYNNKTSKVVKEENNNNINNNLEWSNKSTKKDSDESNTKSNINPIMAKKCNKCGFSSNILNDIDNKMELCEKCLKELLRDYCLSEYFVYVQTLNTGNKFDLSKITLTYKGIDYTFDYIFKLIIKYFPSFTKKKFENEIKSSICIYNMEDISQNKQKIMLSCGCYICNECSKELLNSDNEDFVCPYCQLETQKEYIIQCQKINQ